MHARLLTLSLCLVALGLAASCGAQEGSPLLEQEALTANDGPMPQAAGDKAVSFATGVTYPLGSGYAYVKPSEMQNYTGSVNEFFVPMLPHPGLTMQSPATTPVTRVYYSFKGLNPKKLERLYIRGNSTGLRVGVWYKTAAAPAWSIAATNYDYFPVAAFGTDKSYVMGGLPHHAASVDAAGRTFVVLEVRGGKEAWLHYLKAGAF